MGQPFVRPITIRFRHCDPAGIVFYPRYFELMNDLVEDWFADGIGVSFAELHDELGKGIPTVNVQCRFAAPSRLGDVLECSVAVERLGNSSATLAIRFAGSDGNVRVQAELVIVLMDLRSARAVPWPEEMRAALGGYLVDNDSFDVE
ncbi:4-hydroxybenzoyl-CoA thioesterase [Pandoraea thiooxydans]|uniref:Uncharacterized protein n=1 Tax=Pandoraea thiooxydans TaxID=445709 RepID=A0A0G3EP06_9BURK|nr:thioesterase family protein [Pandoraea thiooxydans]AKJ68730.1 hypothetical protein ABW99_11395 [Pandoraea thiooxydans]APR96175.1 4-hydroxybenzoyl-CoA thioesterase [Pandoraea thiooxydans]